MGVSEDEGADGSRWRAGQGWGRPSKARRGRSCQYLVADVLVGQGGAGDEDVVGLGHLDETAAVRERVGLLAWPRRVFQGPLDSA